MESSAKQFEEDNEFLHQFVNSASSPHFTDKVREKALDALGRLARLAAQGLRAQPQPKCSKCGGRPRGGFLRPPRLPVVQS